MPENISKEQSRKREHIFTLGMGVFCLLCHLFLFLFFLHFHITPLVIINAVSVMIYAFTLIMKDDTEKQNRAFIHQCELTANAILSTIILSVDGGYFLYGLQVPVISYIALKPGKRVTSLMCVNYIGMFLSVILSRIVAPVFADYRAIMVPYNHYFLANTVLFAISSTALAIPFFMSKKENNTNELKYGSEHDALTGIFNRNYFNQFISDAITCGEASGSVIMFDIDDFKKINDKYGHDVGDLALKMVSKCTAQVLDEGNVFTRWGGEEFLIYLPGVSNKDAAEKAEKVRATLAENPYHEDKCLTVSLGVTSLSDGEEFEQALNRADNNLYTAKSEGKNRVCAN